MKKRIVLTVFGILFLLMGVLGVFVATQKNPLPEAKPGPAAEALADKMLTALNQDAWDQATVLRWSLGGRPPITWDRARGLVQVGEAESYVQFSADKAIGFSSGSPLDGEALKSAWKKAREDFINDGYWLNPVAKIRDPLTTRKIATVDGRQALLVEHTGGGVTPGDKYLWLVGDDGVPTAWRMWTDVVPIPGVEVTWSSWQEVHGGAKVATVHQGLGLTLKIENLQSAGSANELPGGDPFKAWTSSAASQPAH